MEHLTSNMEQQNQVHQIEWRRDKVQELANQGHIQSEISRI